MLPFLLIFCEMALEQEHMYDLYHIDLILANEPELEFLLSRAIGKSKSNTTVHLSEWLVLFMSPCWVKEKEEKS